VVRRVHNRNSTPESICVKLGWTRRRTDSAARLRLGC
jgi:hypothetical protein